MQDRYTGDIGDFVKYGLLRAVAGGRSLGVAWYLHPDEGPAGDGRHVDYLDRPAEWQHLDCELYACLREIVRTGNRSVQSVQDASLLRNAVFAGERLDVAGMPSRGRESWRHAWLERVLRTLEGCDVVFADPDNGICADDRFRPTTKRSAKHVPVGEIEALAANNRTVIVYHHNSRRKGGHRAEISSWQKTLPGDVHAYYWRRWSNRTFFVVNAGRELVCHLQDFAARWASTGAELISPPP